MVGFIRLECTFRIREDECIIGVMIPGAFEKLDGELFEGGFGDFGRHSGLESHGSCFKGIQQRT